MNKIFVQVKDDHLQFLSRSKPMLAVSELIWNALDAEATNVDVEFVENDLGGLEIIRVRDNGLGLSHADAPVAFENLGGSWKRDKEQTPNRKRAIHGKYGKGRFRAFAMGNWAKWTSVYEEDGAFKTFDITGRAVSLGEFDLTEAAVIDASSSGMTVEITDLPEKSGVLRGGKALQEVTELFALYMRQYPDIRVVYDGVPLDPANTEDRCTSYGLGEMVMQNGERVNAMLTIVEWKLPGKRGVILCDDHGFALRASRTRQLFRGFSYTAYLKSSHLATLDDEGLLDIEDLSPDLVQMLDSAKTKMRQHFALREAEHGQEILAMWQENGLYPYDGPPADKDEETERRIFDIYATHLNQISNFSRANHLNKRLILRLLRELVNAQPTRVARVLDDLLTFPEDKEEELADLLEA